MRAYSGAGYLRHLTMISASCKLCGGANRCSLALMKASWGALARAATVVSLRKGDTVYREGLPAEGIFLLSRGSMSLTTVTESGTQRILNFVTCGELFGLDALLPERTRCQTAEAREDSQCVSIYPDQFRNTLLSTPALMWHVMLTLNDMLRRANEEKLAISGTRVRDRLRDILSDLSQRRKQLEKQRRPSFAKLKQRELAEILGVPEETICRELRLLKSNLKNEVLSGRVNAIQQQLPWTSLSRLTSDSSGRKCG